MLTSGCCAVSETPAVCVWKRSSQRSLVPRAEAVAQLARPDPPRGAVLRDLLEEIEVRVEEEREPRRELVDVEPARDAPHSTYVKPLASVKASSCAAVEPASRMW